MTVDLIELGLGLEEEGEEAAIPYMLGLGIGVVK